MSTASGIDWPAAATPRRCSPPEVATAAPPAGLRRAVPLGEFTTWKVGGPAEWFAEPASREELIALAAWAVAEGIPYRCIGAGSNLLIADAGLEGLTLCNRRLQGSRLDGTSAVVEAEAGEPIPTLARKAARLGLAGLEWAVGIPGTVGGAVVMNAGAQWGCLAESFVSAEVIDPARPAEPFTLGLADLAFAYRHSRLQPGQEPAAVSGRTSANLHSRTSTQPYQQPSCGSVFRNPEPRKAGQLIEALGLKGLAIGGAQVSPIHANFIVNTGGATAAEIDQLIAEVQRRVAAAHAVTLHPEVKRLGPFDAISLAA
ncbi:MAG: UDP-N-acetylmuramate dehydrogenase [Cyanobium sp.]